jgi:serine/threonine protein kinase
MNGDNNMVITLLAAGCEVQDFPALAEIVDDLGHRKTAAIIKKYHEQPWLFSNMRTCKFKHLDSWFSKVLSMSQNRIMMLERISLQLLANGKFDEETLAAVIARVAQKNPKIVYEFVEKTKTNNRSIMKSSEKTLFYQNQRAIKTTTLYGTRGKVTQGYSDQSTAQPLFAIKWMESTIYAVEEARCQQRLARMNPYVLFYKSKVAVVLEWQKGKNLGQFTEDDFINHPLLRRIKCLISLLTDINMLHASLHCHNDLNGGNVMLDFSEDKMSLIDFELACKPRDKRDWQGDMSSVGEIIELIFPEIKISSSSSIHIQAISILREAVRWQNYNLAIMPTSEQALDYCREILMHADILDADILKSIADRTINRNVPTLEDMVRTCERSKVMKSV